MQKLIFQTESVSQCHLNFSNMHAKNAQNWQIALFNYFCLSEFFATLYIYIESCKKFGQTELIKKSNRTILTDFCMQFLFSYNLETQNRTEKLDFACKIFPK